LSPPAVHDHVHRPSATALSRILMAT
jgi:hypothetical protein